MFKVEPEQVGTMLVRWHDSEGLTYGQMAERLAAKDAGLSPSRIAELVLDAQGDKRPPKRERPWARREQARV
jgi:hypothetical protein